MTGNWVWDKEAMMDLMMNSLQFPVIELKITFDNKDPRVELVERTKTDERVWSTVDLGVYDRKDIISVYLPTHVEATNFHDEFRISIKPIIEAEITKE